MKQLAQFYLWLALLATVQMADATVFTVFNTSDSGVGSLRQALLDANATPGADTVIFNLPGLGPYTIAPVSALPIITESVIIDGYSQPGFVAQPVIELSGAASGSFANGLYLIAGDCVIRGLVIHSFRLDGIRIEGFGNNIIQGNFIGTDITGTLVLGIGAGGITLFLSSSNLIGGGNAGDRNVIAGARSSGINMMGLESHNNRVEGNFIGTDVNGNFSLGNTNNGVTIADAPRNVIGGTNAAARNIISGNRQSGVYLIGGGSQGNLVLGNFIGTDIIGRHAISNLSDGVTVLNSSSNTIGGGSPGARNIISGNQARGIIIAGRNSQGNQVLGNYIGTDVTGKVKLGNAQTGVMITEAVGNCIGGTNALARNLISGNKQEGIVIADTNATLNLILGNYVGTDDTGTARLGNALSGITVSGISNYIGGDVAGAGNLISGNDQNGIFIAGTNSGFNQVMGNFIGTDAGGAIGINNAQCGISIANSVHNQIGDIQRNAGNLISGNLQLGVYLSGLSTRDNCIQGNLIGTDANGAFQVSNGVGVGIYEAASNTVGGTVWGARNVISGNLGQGIYIMGDGASQNNVMGNFIGTDKSGNQALGNYAQGVYLSAPGNFIGGSLPGAGNLISGNQQVGVSIGDLRSSNNVVQGNFIGTQMDGLNPLGNRLHNVEILSGAANNIIGGIHDGAGNRIAFAVTSEYDGVRIRQGCQGNICRGNSIFGNSGLGIDLGDNGVTANDLGDLDGMQNYPVLTVVTGRYLTTIKGTLMSRPNQQFTIDFYLNPQADTSGYGEGQSWLGMVTTQTDANGNAQFSTSVLNSAPAVGFISATAMDSAGNVSEFSNSIQNSFGASSDSDGDGLPDDYEIAWGFNPNNPTDALADSDGDGRNNLSEYRASCNPRSATDVLRFLPSSVFGRDQTMLVFNTVEGSRYQVEFANQPTGPWFSLATNVIGIRVPVRVFDTNSASVPMRFYRLKAFSINLESDGDGMPDEYELAWGFNPNDSSDALADSDGDGLNNLSEYRAGCNPRSAADVLRFLSTSEFSLDQTKLYFNTVAGKRYQVDFASQTTGPWFAVATNIIGIGTPVQVLDSNHTNVPMRFYRLKVD